MHTYVYMVRHGDSPKWGNERTRELTFKGNEDAKRVIDILKERDIDVVISSPYKRSIQTVQGLADQLGQEVIIYEDLKERIFTMENKRISDEELFPLLKKSFCEPSFSSLGGESNAECQIRGIKVLKKILTAYPGRNIVIGTHGAVMTLMMGYFHSRYGLEFLLDTSKPDIYKMEFNGETFVNAERVWELT